MSETATLRVLFFASLRDAVGCAELTLPMPQPPSLAGLMALLKAQLGDRAMALEDESVRIAINQELVATSLRFSPNDEVAFLPPVTGG